MLPYTLLSAAVLCYLYKRPDAYKTPLYLIAELFLFTDDGTGRNSERNELPGHTV